MEKRYTKIATFLYGIAEAIDDESIELYSKDPDDLIDWVCEELHRNY